MSVHTFVIYLDDSISFHEMASQKYLEIDFIGSCIIIIINCMVLIGDF